MSKILLVGQDFRLLATRAAVLAKTSASVVCCNMAEATRILLGERFDLVVLCHSLDEDQETAITDMVHRRWPRTRILMVVSAVSQERFYGNLNFDAMSSPEPDRLIRHAAALLDGLPHHRTEEPLQGSRLAIAAVASNGAMTKKMSTESVKGAGPKSVYFQSPLRKLKVCAHRAG